MLQKRKIFISAICIVFVAIIFDYTYKPIYWIHTFFSLSLTNPEGPFDELILVHYALSSYIALTPVARDAKGNLYIAGRKDAKVRVLVLNSKGKITHLITPRAKDGRFLRVCLLSVSPSGNHIWTISPINMWFDCVTLHDASGKAKYEWMIDGRSASHLLINAYSENGAYLATCDSILHFIIGQNYPQKFPGSTLSLFFHDGKYWSSDRLDWLIESLPEQQRQSINRVISGIDPTKFWGIVSWTHKKGFRLEKVIPFNKSMTAMIHGIDQDGNFYVHSSAPVKGPLDFLLNFLFKIKPLATKMQNVGICNPIERRIEVIKVFSSSGGILDVIPIARLIKQQGDKIKKYVGGDKILYVWERTHYGQLVKIDETGIYLEVVIGSMKKPEEYQIVRIVKKPRWKAWLDGLTR